MSRKRKSEPQRPPQEFGDDGWPRYGYWIQDVEQERRVALWRREQDLQQHLSFLKKVCVESEYFPALMDAFNFCRRYQLPLPEWLGQHVEAILSHWYSKHTKLWKRCEAMTDKREMHLKRYSEIEEQRIHGVKWDPKRDQDIFQKAAERISEAPSTIRASYRKVAAAYKKGDAHSTYAATYRRRPIGVKKPSKKRRFLTRD